MTWDSESLHTLLLSDNYKMGLFVILLALSTLYVPFFFYLKTEGSASSLEFLRRRGRLRAEKIISFQLQFPPKQLRLYWLPGNAQ